MKPCYGFSNSSDVCAEFINVLRIPRITAETGKALKKGISLLARMIVTYKPIFFMAFFSTYQRWAFSHLLVHMATSNGWMVGCEHHIAAKVIEGVPMVTAPNNSGLTNP